MKKLIITVITALLVLLMGTYVVGEVLKNEVQKTNSMHQSPEFQLELVHYQKSFLTAQAQVKVVLPMEGEKPLHFLVDADIHHYNQYRPLPLTGVVSNCGQLWDYRCLYPWVLFHDCL